jgi:hypothetical protein
VVVDVLNPIQADPYIGYPNPFKLMGDLWGDEGAIGGKDRTYPQ